MKIKELLEQRWVKSFLIFIAMAVTALVASFITVTCM